MNTPIIMVETFRVPLQEVWKAITDQAAMQQWYFDIEDFTLTEGGSFNFYEGPAKAYHHRCEVLEVVPNKRFRHTWTHPSHSKGTSILTWELDEVDGETRLTLTHQDTEEFADAGSDFSKANFEVGWHGIVRINLRNYLYHIERVPFTVEINAPAEKVWEVMWNKDSYTQWTAPFCAGSYYEGDLEANEIVHFLAPDGSGMYSQVFYVKPYEKIIFSHIGSVKEGEEMPVDEETRLWTGSLEMYTLTEKDGVTTLLAEVDVDQKHKDYMLSTFPKALEEVKRLSTDAETII